jgi:hypothetical protein
MTQPLNIYEKLASGLFRLSPFRFPPTTRVTAISNTGVASNLISRVCGFFARKSTITAIDKCAKGYVSFSGETYIPLALCKFTCVYKSPRSSNSPKSSSVPRQSAGTSWCEIWAQPIAAQARSDSSLADDEGEYATSQGKFSVHC